MFGRKTNATILQRMLLAGLVVVLATSAATIAIAAEADQKDEQKNEQAAEESKAGEDGAGVEGESDAAAATEADPQVGGNAAVPRPRKPVKLPSKIDPKTGKKVLVLTNDGLVEIFGERQQGLEPAAVPYEVESGEAPKGAAGEEQAEEAMPPGERDQRAAQIRQDLRRLRSNLLRYRNPLLPRPEVTEDEAAAQRGKDNVQRIELTNEKIAALEAELTELEREAVENGSDSTQ